MKDDDLVQHAMQDFFEKSNAWDANHNLPLVPMHNNQWTYLAYAFRNFEGMGVSLPVKWKLAAANYLSLCEIRDGFITRTPKGNEPSHDELMGAAYVFPGFASRAIDYLNRSDGVYNSDQSTDRFNVFRFIFMMPFLKASAGFRVGLASQFLWSLHCVITAIRANPGRTSGLLKVWLMAPKMRQFDMCSRAYDVFVKIVTEKGFTPDSIFGKYYLTECPAFFQTAPKEWK